MSEFDTLHQRGAALENQFFADLDAKLLAELKSKQQHADAVAEFERITGIQDTKVIDAMLKLGVGPQTIAALRVFPLIAVAWADGKLDASERMTINTLAATHLLLKDCPAGALLERWMSAKPTSEVFAAWELYARSLIQSLSPPEAESLKTSLMSELNAVAHASGGLLGLGSVSPSESATIQRITSALTRS